MPRITTNNDMAQTTGGESDGNARNLHRRSQWDASDYTTPTALITVIKITAGATRSTLTKHTITQHKLDVNKQRLTHQSVRKCKSYEEAAPVGRRETGPDNATKLRKMPLSTRRNKAALNVLTVYKLLPNLTKYCQTKLVVKNGLLRETHSSVDRGIKTEVSWYAMSGGACVQPRPSFTVASSKRACKCKVVCTDIKQCSSKLCSSSLEEHVWLNAQSAVGEAPSYYDVTVSWWDRRSLTRIFFLYEWRCKQIVEYVRWHS